MLEQFMEWLMYSAIGLSHDRWVEALEFFLCDSIKIIALLFFMITAIGIVRTYLPQSKIRKWISGKYGTGNLAASIFGSITPFCSCSSIPFFLSFVKGAIPLGIAFSFLITSPLVNEYLVALMLGFFGWKITLAYVVSGILIGTIAGIVLGRMGLEKYLVRDVAGAEILDGKYSTFMMRVRFGTDEALGIVKKLWLWVLMGVGIGALIHNYIPAEAIQAVVEKGGIFAVPLAVVLGIPMYGSCTAIVPIAVALFDKGVPLGTALAFMMATAALSLPEAVILRRAMKLKMICIFFSVVGVAIILTGYMFNVLQSVL